MDGDFAGCVLVDSPRWIWSVLIFSLFSDLHPSSLSTAPVWPMLNSPVELNSGGVRNPRVSPIVNPLPSGNIVDLLEQVTVLRTDHLQTSPTGRQNNDGTGWLKQIVGSSWSTIVSGGAGGSTPGAVAERMQFEYIPPTILNDRIVVTPPVEVEELGHPKWQRCIVGHFLDKKLTFSAVRNIAMRIWERLGIREILSNDKGFFFLFMFEGEKFRQLLELGPWHFGDKLLILKLWHPHLKLEKERLSKIPLWVYFFNVPLEMWTGPGLSHIACSVGRPLYADRLTKSRHRLNYAKICVEVDCLSPLPESFDLKYANGDMEVIRIQHPWKPQICSVCQVFGHSEGTCPSKVNDKEQGNGGVVGDQGKAVQVNGWQVVGTRKENSSGLGGLRSAVSLQAAQVSTSKPISGLQLPTVVSPVNGESSSGPKLMARVNSVPVQSKLDVPGSGRPLDKGRSGVKAVSEPSRFAVLDALGLSVGCESNEMDVSLPDEASDQGAMLTSEIGLDSSEVETDVPVESQSKVSPIAGAGMKAKGKGGEKGLPKGRGGKKNNH
ncbi:uncharacterized protein LOC131332431 [Rhododendron vialii]|uniref:uncharacterized protein LOC131332431 n=1 Tax=Rhododendron vialii TaxID=182163 RepID=UPI00265F55B7|nr:uncharacterized protein LOC131332431 [Rhododendron vialii]